MPRNVLEYAVAHTLVRVDPDHVWHLLPLGVATVDASAYLPNATIGRMRKRPLG